MKFITFVALVAFMAAGAQAGGEAGLGGRSPQGLSQRSAGQLAGPDPGRWGLPTSFGGPWTVGHRAFDAGIDDRTARSDQRGEASARVAACQPSGLLPAAQSPLTSRWRPRAGGGGRGSTSRRGSASAPECWLCAGALPRPPALRRSAPALPQQLAVPSCLPPPC